MVSTHSRPKAAATGLVVFAGRPIVSTHSRPKAAALKAAKKERDKAFQHTAARRRLHHELRNCVVVEIVSTHSRPKAAARKFLQIN